MSKQGRLALEWSLDLLCWLESPEDVVFATLKQIDWRLSPNISRRLDLYRIIKSMEHEQWKDCLLLFVKVFGKTLQHREIINDLARMAVVQMAKKHPSTRLDVKDIFDCLCDDCDYHDISRLSSKLMSRKNTSSSNLILPQKDDMIETMKLIVREENISIGRPLLHKEETDGKDLTEVISSTQLQKRKLFLYGSAAEDTTDTNCINIAPGASSFMNHSDGEIQDYHDISNLTNVEESRFSRVRRYRKDNQREQITDPDAYPFAMVLPMEIAPQHHDMRMVGYTNTAIPILLQTQHEPPIHSEGFHHPYISDEGEPK